VAGKRGGGVEDVRINPLARHRVEILFGREMRCNVREVGSRLAECGEFIDRKNYRLGRLQSEMRTEYKN
jgi:hypothetical protein